MYAPAWASGGRDWLAGRMTPHASDSPLFPTAFYRSASCQFFASWHDCFAYHAMMYHVRGRIRPLMAGHLLPAHALLALLDQARQALSQEPNVLRLAGPVTVVGSLHGQHVDLLNLFLINGEPPDTNYLFLGRYVNRGLYGVETASLLLALKVAFPERIHLLRGSHETRQITEIYGFKDECLRKYGGGGGGGEEVWQAFMNTFDALPVAAIINDKTLCLHSGLSPSLDTIAQIEELDRFQDIPPEGPLADLAWNQPEDVEGWQIPPRAAGFLFGSAVTGDWLDKHGLDLLVTTSSLVMEGFKCMHDGRLLLLWSAPNYCDRCQNLAAVLCASEHAAGPHSLVTYGRAPSLPLPVGREPLLRTFPVTDAQDLKNMRDTALAVALTNPDAHTDRTA